MLRRPPAILPLRIVAITRRNLSSDEEIGPNPASWRALYLERWSNGPAQRSVTPIYFAGSNAPSSTFDSTATDVNFVTVSPSAVWLVTVIGTCTPLTLR